MLAPPLGAYLMRESLWTPIIIGYLCLLLAVWLTILMPETRFTDEEPARHDPGSPGSEEIPDSQGSKFELGVKSRLDAAVGHTLSTVGFVVKHRNLVLLMAGFFSTDFAQQSVTVLLRYVSTRYSIPLAKVFAPAAPSPSLLPLSRAVFPPSPLTSSILLLNGSLLRPNFVILMMLTREPVNS